MTRSVNQQSDHPKAAPALSQSAVRERPVSHGQRGLWFLHRMSPDSAAHHIARAARLSQEVNVATLRQTFQLLVERHDCLRTTFAAPQGKPLQQIHDRVEICFRHEDATSWNDDFLKRRMSEEAYRPFDLEQGPLLRVYLFTRSAREHLLLLSVHHIISDFWSLALIVKEMAAIYESLMNDAEPALASLPVQYADYVRWERDMLLSTEGDRLSSYWEGQLAGELPILNLPTDRPRPAVQTFSGAAVPFRISAELTGRLKALSRANSTTLYATLLAAFQVLLYRHTGQDDILIGSPLSGRKHAGFRSLVGYFINIVALRARMDGSQTFRDFLGATRQTARDAAEHQDYPFSLLVERLQVGRDLSRSPLFQAMFILQKTPLFKQQGMTLLALGEEGGTIELGSLCLEPISLEQRIAQFDLTMQIGESEGGLRGAIEYNRDLFNPPTITRMAAHFQQLLDSIAADPDQPISRLPMLTEAEQQQLLKAFNPTPTAYPQESCIHEMFEQQVRRTPQAIAVVCGNEQVSYAELNRRAERVASYLRRRGVGVEAKVGICTSRSINMVAGLLGVLKAGAAYVPLDPAYPVKRLQYVVEDAAVEVVLVEAATSQVLSDSQVEAVCIEHLLTAQADNDDQESEALLTPDGGKRAEAANLGYVIYTSGSTGQPKGIGISHRSAVAMIAWATETFSAAELSAVLASTSICFDLSVFEIFVPLSMGGRIVVVNNVLEVLNDSAAGEVKLINTVPSAMAELVRLRGVPASVEVVNLAGEALSRKLVEAVYEQAGVKAVWNLYGPSEDTTYSTYAKIERGEVSEPVIGRGVANTRLYVVSREQELVPLGVVGELCIAGAGLARGYEGRAAQTAERFVPNPWSEVEGERMYRTGDLVRWTEAGELEYLGRADHQVKVRGFRIELGEIEEELRQQPAVAQAVVVVREEGGGKRLVCYLEQNEGEKVEVEQIRRNLSLRLPEYMIPAQYVVMSKLPLTPNGKIDRRALPAPQNAPTKRGEIAKCATPTEKEIAKIWAELLRLDDVAPEDNFFDLGGHSLTATQLLARVQERFGVMPGLRDFLVFPSVRAIAETVDQLLLAQANSSKIAEMLRLLEEMDEGQAESILAEGEE